MRRMMQLVAVVAVVCFSQLAFAGSRLSAAPSSVTITVSGLVGMEGARHNGTWTLTPAGPQGAGTWVYTAISPAGSQTPSAGWGLTVDENNQIWIKAGAGQFPVGYWGVIGDVYTIGGAPQISGGNSTYVQIVANP